MGGGASKLAKSNVEKNSHRFVDVNCYSFERNDKSRSCGHQLYTCNHDDEDEIDAELVYSALSKMSFYLEIDESLKEKLTIVICNTPYSSERARLFEVRAWIKSELSANLKYQETLNLIKYVELYEPEPANDDCYTANMSAAGIGSIDSEDFDRDYRHLDCPFRCNVVVLTAEIQRQRLSKSVPLYSNTDRIVVSDSIQAIPGAISALEDIDDSTTCE